MLLNWCWRRLFRVPWIERTSNQSILKKIIAAAKSLQSCLTLRDPIDGSPPGSPIPGTLQARILDWVAISFSNAWKWKVKVKLFSWVRLCDPMDFSPPGSPIHGILQARVLEWGAIAFSEENHYWIFIRRPDTEVETLILWPSDMKNWLIGKDPDAGKDWRQEKRTT